MSWLVQGKGLSAALVVDALFQRGVEPHTIYQKGDLAAPAGSLAPAALLNPLTGRSLKPPMEGPKVFAQAQSTWSRLQRTFPDSILSQTLHRPFIGGHALFEKLRKTFETHFHALQDGWGARYATPGEVKMLQAATTETCGAAMTLEGTFAVKLPEFLEAFWESAFQSGLQKCNGSETHEITLRCDGGALRSILPASLPLAPLGGELFHISPIDDLPYGHALAGDGHYIRLSSESAVVGSTYRRDGQTTEHSAWEHLQRRLQKWLPNAEAEPQGEWYGERLIVPDDRRPILGHLSDEPLSYACTGFASKGLYWAPYSAKLLIDHILSGADIDPWLTTYRHSNA